MNVSRENILRLRINRYFILILLYCIGAGYSKQIFILFLFVMLHEMCHVIVAYIIGLEIKNIETFPFGGVARIDNLNSIGPYKEIILSLSGPIFNLAAASILFFLNIIGFIPYYDYLIKINMSIALFNLLPGLPLDGGRVLRAILSLVLDFKQSTKIVVISGKIISIMLLFLGIGLLYFYNKFNVSLLITPFFIFISAKREGEDIMYTILKDIINKKKHIQFKGFMKAAEICVYENVCIKEVIKYFDLNKYHIVVVIDKDMGIKAHLTETQIFEGICVYGGNTTLVELCEKIKNSRNIPDTYL